jgi:multimeric flavodoxin WrbA
MAQAHDFSDLKALFFNGTLNKGLAVSNTDGLINASKLLMEHHGVNVEVIRTINHDIATGIYPDMREQGWETDAWPDEIYPKVLAADIVVIAGPIWLGDNSSQTKKIIERLYGNSSEMNQKGQWIYYGKAGGCLISGNEDGIKHCAMNILYSLQHIGFTIPPQADAGWIGEVGPGPSYLDEGSGGPENDFTNRNLTFMTYNLLHTARRLKDGEGIPAYGNLPEAWKNGEHFGFFNPNSKSQ